jgi:DNA-binding beta-propeller fold protein YncE
MVYAHSYQMEALGGRDLTRESSDGTQRGMMKRTLAVLTLLLLPLLGSCTNAKPQTERSPSPTASTTVSGSISFVYGMGPYAYHGYWRRAIDGRSAERVTQTAFEPYHVTASPDGRWLVRRAYVQEASPLPTADLSIGSADSIDQFHVIVRAHNTQIGDVVWTADSSTIFYTLFNSVSVGRLTTRLFRVNRDGSGRALVQKLDAGIDSYSIEAVDLKGGVLYALEGSSLEAINLSTGGQQPIASSDSIVDAGYAFSADGGHLYYVRESEFIDRNLATGNERSISRMPIGRRLRPVAVSPTGQALIVADDNSGPGPSHVLVLALDGSLTGTLTPLRYNAEFGFDARWAPDGQHLWFECRCGPNGLVRGVITDPQNSHPRVIADSHQGKNDDAQFVTWLVA